MPAITFTEFEYARMANAAEKLMEARKNMPPQQWRKPQHRAVRAFVKKFPLVTDATEQTRILDRTDMRLIQELCEKAAGALIEGIIPSYEQRIAKSPDKADYYKPYLEKAIRMRDAYKSILAKIEDAL